MGTGASVLPSLQAFQELFNLDLLFTLCAHVDWNLYLLVAKYPLWKTWQTFQNLKFRQMSKKIDKKFICPLNIFNFNR